MATTNPDRASHFPAIERKYGQPMAYWFDQMAQLQDLKYPEQMAYLQENHGFSRAHANALIMYCKGNTSSRRFDTVEQYLAQFDEVKGATSRAILAAFTSKYSSMQTVIAWNHPMVRYRDAYVFGLSVHTRHILLAPFDADILHALSPRLSGYEVNKKTFAVPVDWKVDRTLMRDLATMCVANTER